MKKRVGSFLIALLLACVLAFAGAEAPLEPAYKSCLGIWASDGIAMEIWQEDEMIQCRAVLTNCCEECDVWEYATCVYDDTEDVLQCYGVTRTRERFDSLLDDIDELDWSTDDMSFAELRLSEEGLLFSDDGLDSPVVLTRLSDVEVTKRNEALAFVGHWTGESAALRVEDHGTCYLFTVTVPIDDVTSHRWSYTCLYDPGSGRIASVNVSTRTVITREADGRIVEIEEDYVSGDAEFILEDGNRLVWRDMASGTVTTLERSVD